MSQLRQYIELVEHAQLEDDRLDELGLVVPGVNTTPDVGPDETKTQAAKFGNVVTKDGLPPLIYEIMGAVTKEAVESRPNPKGSNQKGQKSPLTKKRRKPGKWFRALFSKPSSA